MIDKDFVITLGLISVAAFLCACVIIWIDGRKR